MPLTPTIVRPSARAWAKRTKFLLNLTKSDCQDQRKIIARLPPSIAFIDDHTVNTEEMLQNSYEIDARHILVLVEEQLSLEDQLTICNESDDESERICDDDIRALSKQL